MKANSTLVVVIRIVAFILLCLYSFLVFGQAEGNSLQKFSAVVNEKNIRLQWTLVPGNNASTIIIEKGYSPKEFKALAEYWVNMEGNYATEYKWSDLIKGKKQLYYRLRIIEANGKASYSNILHFNGQKSGENLAAISTLLPEQTVSIKSSAINQKSFFEPVGNSKLKAWP